MRKLFAALAIVGGLALSTVMPANADSYHYRRYYRHYHHRHRVVVIVRH
jgi:hypothetical protein